MLEDWQKKINPTIAASVIAAAAGVLWLLDRGVVAQSAAVCALLMTLPTVYRAVQPAAARRFDRLRPSVRDRIIRYAPYVVVVTGTLIALGPVTLGQMPVSQDHANHYYATHLLVHEIISSGRLFGWTDSLGTGYPFGDTYHTLSYLVTGLLHLISFRNIFKNLVKHPNVETLAEFFATFGAYRGNHIGLCFNYFIE